eukprot:1594627-Rhodomonas_salina.1
MRRKAQRRLQSSMASHLWRFLAASCGDFVLIYGDSSPMCGDMHSTAQPQTTQPQTTHHHDT